VKVALLGAHTDLARAVVERAEDRGLDVEWILATASEHLEPDLVLLTPQALSGADLVVAAFDDRWIRDLAGGLAERGAPVVDAAGVLEGPKHFPSWVAGETLPGGPVRLPSGPEVPAFLLARALGSAGAAAGGGRPARADVVALESVARRDRPGIEALSAGARAVFTLQDPDPGPFFASPAFNLMAEADAFEGQGLSRATEAALGRPVPGQHARIGVPTFGADLVGVRVAFEGDEDLTAEAFHESLSAAPLLRPAELPWAGSDAMDRDDLAWTGLWVGARDAWVWGFFDRQRLGGALPVVRVLELCASG